MKRSSRIEREQGHVDVLADSVAGEDPLMDEWGPFWEVDVSRGDALLRQALLSRLITARHAARLMIRQRRGLIVELTENDLLGASGNVLTQLARMAHKMLVTVFALELREHGVAALALTPGFLAPSASSSTSASRKRPGATPGPKTRISWNRSRRCSSGARWPR